MPAYHLSLIPGCKKDTDTMRRIIQGATRYPDGTALFGYMPLSDRDENGKRTRCPAGADIYTSCGWNMLQKTVDHFTLGNKVTFDVYDS